METLYEGETVESRLEQIQEKLSHIPLENDETARYYVYYKQDIRFLLELLDAKS